MNLICHKSKSLIMLLCFSGKGSFSHERNFGGDFKELDVSLRHIDRFHTHSANPTDYSRALLTLHRAQHLCMALPVGDFLVLNVKIINTD